MENLAEGHKETVMPGYTHLQRAQPVTLAMHLGAYVEMFKRDSDRFRDCLKRTDLLPLGAGALAGTTYPIDREFVAKELGFSEICENTMDAVSDRDFAIEFVSCCAMTMMHLSRLCEELILWNSTEFSFIEMDDAFSTGSSIMPQKKNPDMAELIRGKTGRVYGDLFALLTIMKGLPLAYNKDMQEDKPPLFDAGDTLKDCLSILTQVISTMEIKTQNMEKAANSGFMNPGPWGYLKEKSSFPGLPRIIRNEFSLHQNKNLDDLTLKSSRTFPVVGGGYLRRHRAKTRPQNQKNNGEGNTVKLAISSFSRPSPAFCIMSSLLKFAQPS